MLKKVSILIVLFGSLSFSALHAQDPLIGEIRMFAGNFAPRGWALCDGQLLAISSNSALFSILGTTYGGDGRTTFGLPDLRGRVAIHEGQGPGLSNYRLGQKGGTETNTMTAAQMPYHGHNVSVLQGNLKGYKAEFIEGNLNFISTGDQAKNTIDTNKVGGNQPVNNIQPYTTVNYIIALQGIYPSRN